MRRQKQRRSLGDFHPDCGSAPGSIFADIAMKAIITLVAGARPNFMKIAPIVRALDRANYAYEIVHTGQHYDERMNAVFLREFGIPEAALFLNAGGGTHAEQTAKIMVGFEAYAAAVRPGLVIVVGDVNSTLACSIAAKKLNIAVAHVEAGLRSGDRTMPEEINRIVTDSISDWFFVTEPEGVRNLLAEGRARERIHHVGHVMIDNLLYQKDKLETLGGAAYATAALKAQLGRYGVVTLHRPSNVDDRETFSRVMATLARIADELPLIFPLHPRTQKQLE